MVSLTVKDFTTAVLKSEGTVPDVSDSWRMSVTGERRTEFSCDPIKHGSLGDSLKDNLFNKLFRNWCKTEIQGTRQCELTVAILL